MLFGTTNGIIKHTLKRRTNSCYRTKKLLWEVRSDTWARIGVTKWTLNLHQDQTTNKIRASVESCILRLPTIHENHGMSGIPRPYHPPQPWMSTLHRNLFFRRKYLKKTNKQCFVLKETKISIYIYIITIIIPDVFVRSQQVVHFGFWFELVVVSSYLISLRFAISLTWLYLWKEKKFYYKNHTI